MYVDPLMVVVFVFVVSFWFSVIQWGVHKALNELWWRFTEKTEHTLVVEVNEDGELEEVVE